METERTDVLITGGAVVGLSTALFLAHRSISSILVERQPSVLMHPRARVINPRAVEAYRQVGLEERIFAVRSLTADMAEKAMVQADTLVGPPRMFTPLGDEVPEITAEVTPCSFCSIDQDRLEDVVRARATELGADIRYSWELTGFEQDDDGVTASVTDQNTGVERHIRARYLVAADGYRSGIRATLGIPMTGVGTLAHVLSLIFKADLTGPLRGRDIGLAYLDKPEHGTLLTPLDGSRWVLFTPYHPEAGETVDSFDEARCVAKIRAAVGVPDLPVELEPQIPKTGATVLGFELAAKVADRFFDGRVFLVGDAAHAIPPTGAFGASTGIQDAHNLAWKLAAVLRDEASPMLLDSYQEERRPVASATVDQAMTELAERMGMGSSDDEAPGYAAIVFGHQYRSGAVVGSNHTATSNGTVNASRDASGVPHLGDAGAPGTRAPHVELTRAGKRISTIDLFGAGFVLLTAEDTGLWRKASDEVAQRFGIDLVVHEIQQGGDLADADGQFQVRYGVSSTGAVLVRPDGVVAWRLVGIYERAEPVELLDGALRQVLART